MSTAEQRAALEVFRAAVAPLGNVRITTDAEGWPIVPGKRGAIEWYCDGIECACRISSPLRGQLALAVFTTRRRLHPAILAIPGVQRHQCGDTELRAIFLPTPETLAAVARVIEPRHRRVLTPEQRARAVETLATAKRHFRAPKPIVDAPST